MKRRERDESGIPRIKKQTTNLAHTQIYLDHFSFPDANYVNFRVYQYTSGFNPSHAFKSVTTELLYQSFNLNILTNNFLNYSFATQ